MILIIRLLLVKLFQKGYQTNKNENLIRKVHMTGFEPAHPNWILAPQASASTNSATCANLVML